MEQKHQIKVRFVSGKSKSGKIWTAHVVEIVRDGVTYRSGLIFPVSQLGITEEQNVASEYQLV